MTLRMHVNFYMLPCMGLLAEVVHVNFCMLPCVGVKEEVVSCMFCGMQGEMYRPSRQRHVHTHAKAHGMHARAGANTNTMVRYQNCLKQFVLGLFVRVLLSPCIIPLVQEEKKKKEEEAAKAKPKEESEDDDEYDTEDVSYRQALGGVVTAGRGCGWVGRVLQDVKGLK
jgi:hypothetical protein